MLDKIKPGQNVHVKVVRKVTNAAASKTLQRVLSKDDGHKQDLKRISKVRSAGYNPQPRGGRLYGGHVIVAKPLKGELGEEGTVKATVDVLRDLKSVERFIEVK